MNMSIDGRLTYTPQKKPQPGGHPNRASVDGSGGAAQEAPRWPAPFQPRWSAAHNLGRRHDHPGRYGGDGWTQVSLEVLEHVMSTHLPWAERVSLYCTDAATSLAPS